MITALAELAEFATLFGLHRTGREWRGACPACGYGNSAFVLTSGRRGLIGWCVSCQNRDAIRAALEAATGGSICVRDVETVRSCESPGARRNATERAIALWNGSEPVTPDDPAGRYLARRYLGFAVCNPALRYRRDVPHPSGSRWPAMLCRIDNAAGEMVAVQRVFLTLDGHKAKLDPVKAAKGPVWTAAIRFGTGPEIVIAEGPETAIAAGIVLGLPAWSAISAGNLARGLTLPVDVQGVVIAADNDAPGIDAAERAARRWQTEGRQVRVVKPDEPGSDFANLLARRAGAPA